jgi:hypothetical protein
MTASIPKMIWTERLKLTLLETLEEGTADLAAVHKIRSNPEAVSWRYETLKSCHKNEMSGEDSLS